MTSWWPRVYAGLILLATIAFSWNPLQGGDDFWAHAAIGRWAIENRAVPRDSLFLWTADIPWVFHAFGAGVVFAWLLQTGGPVLALCFNAFMAILPFALIWFWWRRNRPFSSLFPLFFLVAIGFSSGRWHLRPELFTATFLTLVFLYFLQPKPSRLSQIALVLMFALWPNLHGACLLGIVTLWASAFATLFDDKKRALENFGLALLCTLAVFIGSAYGFGYVENWRGLGSPLFLTVDEWKPFWWKPILAPEVTLAVFLVWGAALACWLKSAERRWMHLAWLLLFGALFLSARRQLWMIGLASTLVLAIYSRGLVGEAVYGWLKRGEKVTDGFRRVARIGAAAILFCGLFLAISREKTPFATLDEKFPTGMASELRKWPRDARLFNDYEYSAALQWLLYGQREFYIDLINAYPPALLGEYLDVLTLKERGLRALDKRKIEIVALRPREKGELLEKLANWLDENPSWRRVYNAKDGTIWVRRSLLRTRNVAQIPRVRPSLKATPS